MQLQECGNFAPVKIANVLLACRFIAKELMCPQIFKWPLSFIDQRLATRSISCAVDSGRVCENTTVYQDYDAVSLAYFVAWSDHTANRSR
jgi:hypothetical protein